MARLTRLLSLAAAFVCLSGGTALAADGPVGPDPTQNFPVNTLPSVCNQPTSTACLNVSVGFLNQARANLGQPPYALPSNFDSLTPAVQEFVLANLDRTLYGLPPITGITAGLSQDAMGGVQSDNDPQPTDTTFNYWTANWAGGFENVVLAYEAWMYDDGPGSGNLDCTSRTSSGCWGHRHDVLWSFGGNGALAAGVASGTDPSGTPGYAMLLGQGDTATYHPAYTYTWAQALAAGAGGAAAAGTTAGDASSTGAGTGTTPAPPKVTVTVSVHGTGAVVDQAGHACRTATCTFSEAPGHPIRLTAHATGHGTFAGWGGACTGPRRTCTLIPGASAATVSAAFSGQAQLSRRTAHSAHARASRLSRRTAHPAHARASRRSRRTAHPAHARASRRDRRALHAAVRVHGGRLELRIAAPAGARLRCSLSARRGAGFAPDAFRPCWSDTIWTRVPRGVYRLRVRTVAGTITRYVRSR
ncbi:MAG TPA: hypothetical protein VFN55_04600 [Solirubrobacteraceae bacterium]|nr:hypothetical protein [Solirubrobacteraceae bacterium]